MTGVRSRLRIPAVILISGRGSNMMALVQAAASPDYPIEFVAIIANRPNAPGVEWARERGIKTIVIDHTSYDSRAEFDESLDKAISACRAELIVCAGFMRILTGEFVSRWANRLINIHPSLLPAFKGLNTHSRALEAGVKISGCTVHFVTPELDTGPIIAQAAVPVLPFDTPETLANRTLQAEHVIYPEALRLVAEAFDSPGNSGQIAHDLASGRQVLYSLYINKL
ncbi:MAG: phosphoribosylglycinamide formyltransferase [Hyphomicrobiaceae bacterium]